MPITLSNGDPLVASLMVMGVIFLAERLFLVTKSVDQSVDILIFLLLFFPHLLF